MIMTIDIPHTDDASAFAEHADRHRRELQVHCYRMLGSFEESEDLVQETFLRAWRGRASFEGRSSFRAWLYRIATNACLDALERQPRVPEPSGELLWLQPFPDSLLDQAGPGDADPSAAIVEKETIELAFMVAIQHLPPRPRAVLILRDVLGWSAKETAALLDTSVASVTSALQRARAALKEHLPERRIEWAPDADPTEAERALLERYVEATEQGDGDALVATMRDDARFWMPPQPGMYEGARTLVETWAAGGFGDPDWGHMRCTLTRANRQPAVAGYVRRAGDDEYRLLAVDVLRVEEGAIAEIVTFSGSALAPFGLAPTLA